MHKLVGSVAVLTLCLSACGSPGAAEDSDTSNFVSSTSSDRMVDVPYYFAVPKAAITTPLDRSAYSYATVWNPSTEVDAAGLRLIVIPQAGKEPAQKKAAREEMSRQLARAGVLEDGDIALSFRPEYASTLPYPHLIMGVTHASLVFTDGGAAFNIDSPLDPVEYVGQFNTTHFIGVHSSDPKVARDLGVDALQIVRPRKLDDARRASLRGWIALAKKDLARVHSQVPFQSDYMTPIFAAQKLTTVQTVTKLGKILLGDASAQLPMYCSEFAWHMLALSSCTADDIKNAPDEGAACVDPMFDPMPIVSKTGAPLGLGEGPLASLMLAPADARGGLVSQLFAEHPENAAHLSSGHAATQQALKQLGVIAALDGYYAARAGGDDAQADALAGGLAQKITANYSPTAYIAHATRTDENRPMDYVATLLFVDSAADLQKAKRLARNPVP